MTTLGGGNKYTEGSARAIVRAPAPKGWPGKQGTYASRKKIYPKRASGLFRDVKWAVMAITLAIYYILPWIRWERGPGLPNQAFLLDFTSQRLLFGPVEIWAQEFYYVTGALVLAALSLFLVTSIAGRMWCGYACPQTVWTDLMIAVERFWQGDRNSRMRLDQQKWTIEKVAKKFATHGSWLVIALLTGGAFVFYFRDAPTLAAELVTGTAPTVAYVFLALFTGTTYLLGGIAREQVCIYMCPWPRIQGAMLDRDSLFISYRDLRGEPRGAHKRNETWDGRGDCIDCKACVAVCPTGIDIRDGPQLECIQCALCIDACNDVMGKIGRPRDLIAYTTVKNLETATSGPRDGWRILRSRTILYSALIALVGGLMLWSLLNRADAQVSIAPDRNPLFVVLSDGSIRNGYTIKIVNRLEAVRHFRLGISGLAGVKLQIAEFESADPVIDVAPAEVRPLKLFVTLDSRERAKLKGDSMLLTITTTDIESGRSTSRVATFSGPAR